MSITIAMPRMSADSELTTAQSKYVESLARAGASVRWVELTDPEKAVAEALECAGLLLPGGGDIEPSLFGQERIPACGEPNPLRDAAEPKLLHAFLAAGKPILGICRGIQVLNAFLGGELYQDIKPLEHLPHNDHWAKIHTVTVRRGTLLAGVGLAEPLRVPLDPEAKLCVRLFQRLYKTVLAEGGNFQPRSHPAGCLMVPKVVE